VLEDVRAKNPVETSKPTPQAPKFNTRSLETNNPVIGITKDHEATEKPKSIASTPRQNKLRDEDQKALSEFKAALKASDLERERQSYLLEEKDREINFLRSQLEGQTLECSRLCDENNHLISELEYLTKTIKKGEADFKHVAANI